MPSRTKLSSTYLHLMMHIFMVHGVDPLVEQAVNIWLHMGTCVRSSHFEMESIRESSIYKIECSPECTPITNIRIHLYMMK
jgi:hypothetical protein